MRNAKATIRPRLYKSLSCIAAVLSLCISAFATCQCTHHEQTAAADLPSCHSHSRDEMVMGGPETPSDTGQIDPGCSCIANIRVPAVVSRSENTSTTATKAIIGTSVTTEPVEWVALVPIVTASGFETPNDIYSSQIFFSGPSRAPPRLNTNKI